MPAGRVFPLIPIVQSYAMSLLSAIGTARPSAGSNLEANKSSTSLPRVVSGG